MSRLSFVLILMACLMVSVGPTHADATSTVFPESSRYSLEIPAEWVSTSTILPNYQIFVGEGLTVGVDEVVLESMLAGESVGDGLIVSLVPIARKIALEDNVNLDELGTIDRLNMGLLGMTANETFTIGDYQAAKSWLETGYLPFQNLPYNGVTAVLVGDFVYRINYGSTSEAGLAALEAIATTFQLNPAVAPSLDPTALTQRPALTIDDAITLPLGSDWLVMYAPTVFSSITYSSEGYFPYSENTSSPEQYTIIADKQGEFLEGYYAGMHTGDPSTDAINGLVIEVTAYPYDFKLRRADVEVTSERRESVLKDVIQNIGRQNAANISTRLINGVPVLSADVTTDSRVGHRDIKAFHLVMIDVNYKFYVLAFAAPAEQWTGQYQALVEVLDKGLTINSFPALAGGIPVGIQIGQQAPDFTATTVDGTTVHLSDYRGKIILLNFWASWCEPCVEEMPVLAELAQDRPDAVVLAVNVEEDETTVATFMEEHDMPFTVLYDFHGELNRLYEVTYYPTNFVIDAEGIIHSRADATGLDRAIQNALNDNDQAE